jgi:hypothetical protein
MQYLARMRLFHLHFLPSAEPPPVGAVACFSCRLQKPLSSSHPISAVDSKIVSSIACIELLIAAMHLSIAPESEKK